MKSMPNPSSFMPFLEAAILENWDFLEKEREKKEKELLEELEKEEEEF